MKDKVIMGGFAGIAATVTYLYGGWSDIIALLVLLIVIDYLSGFAVAYSNGKLSSSQGFKGITKKILMLLIVALAFRIDIVLNTEIIFLASVWFYIANELLSITENAGKLGVPIPPSILKGIEVLKGKNKNI